MSIKLIEVSLVIGTIGVLVVASMERLTQLTTASDVAKAKANLGRLVIGMEAYYVDNDAVPFGVGTGRTISNGFGVVDSHLLLLTTPVAYAESTDFEDPFSKLFRRSGSDGTTMANASPISAIPDQANFPFYYKTWNSNGISELSQFGAPPPTRAIYYLLQSAGPDTSFYNIGGAITNDRTPETVMNLFYDPTNGATSTGSLWGFSARVYTDSAPFAAGTGMQQAFFLADKKSEAQGWVLD